MSSYWRVVCETCEARGPQFGRKAGGMTWADPQLPRDAWEEGAPVMCAFLIEHEYHDLRLEHE